MHLKRITALMLLLLLIAVGSVGAEPPRYLELTLLTTNDLHATLLPFDETVGMPPNVMVNRNVGGAARRATVIKETRRSSRSPVLLLDSGDTTWGRSALARTFRGAADIAVMNAIGYDAMAPGNHDFQLPSTDMLRNWKSSAFPWVCANVTVKKTGKPLVEPYVIRNILGVRVAFFGLTVTYINDNKAYKSSIELGLHVKDPRETAAALVPELRKKADIVILLSHLGAMADQQLAKEVPGIDVILGGHSHTLLKTPRMVSRGEPSAFFLEAVPIVQAGKLGSNLGRTRVIFRRDTRSGRYTLMSCKGEMIRIDSSIAEDPQIANVIRYYREKLPKPAPKPN